MSVYRENARWGSLISEHRARAVSYFIAAALGIAATIWAVWWLRQPHERHVSTTRVLIGALVIPAVSGWMAYHGWSLRRRVVRCFENGISYSDGRVLLDVEWTAIRSIRAEYVPGAGRTGTANDRNLVAVVLSTPSGPMSLPKELGDYDSLCELIARKVSAPWERTEIPTLMHRS